MVEISLDIRELGRIIFALDRLKGLGDINNNEFTDKLISKLEIEFTKAYRNKG